MIAYPPFNYGHYTPELVYSCVYISVIDCVSGMYVFLPISLKVIDTTFRFFFIKSSNANCSIRVNGPSTKFDRVYLSVEMLL